MGKRMKTSKAQVLRTAAYEEYRARPYRATPAEQYLTIGYGHYGPDVKANMNWPKSKALTVLRKDLKTAEDAVNRLVKVGINQNRFDALVDLVFNIGVGAFTTSTLLRLLNQSDYGAAAKQFARWNKQNGVALGGLTRRRGEEEHLFMLHT